MNRVYLVRHGENWANLTKQFSHRKVDYSLTPKGVMQAQQTADYFRGRPLHAIYSSPLRRALETAQIIAAPHGLAVTPSEHFRELNVGALDGESSREAWQAHRAVWAAWEAGQVAATFPDGEDYRSVLRRMRAGLAEAVRGRVGHNIVVVGHGGLFVSTIYHLCPDAAQQMVAGEFPNCAVSELDVAEHSGEVAVHLRAWARCDHLQGEAALFEPGAPRWMTPNG